MTSAEAMVLATATVLGVAVVAQGRAGILNPRVGALLLILAILAASAAVLHMFAWWPRWFGA